jgi:hypothetical protein
MTTFGCLRFETPQPGGPDPRIFIPQEKGGPVIAPGTAFPFLASYNSQGYGRGIQTRLHYSANCLQDNSSAWTTQKTRLLSCCRGVFTAPLHSNGRGVDHIENTVLILLRACTLWALPSKGRCLKSHCLATGLSATVSLNLAHKVVTSHIGPPITGVTLYGDYSYRSISDGAVEDTEGCVQYIVRCRSNYYADRMASYWSLGAPLRLLTIQSPYPILWELRTSPPKEELFIEVTTVDDSETTARRSSYRQKASPPTRALSANFVAIMWRSSNITIVLICSLYINIDPASFEYYVVHRKQTLFILWHVCWKQELWSFQREPFLGNGLITVTS